MVTRKKWVVRSTKYELTFSVQRRSLFSMPVGTEEEPDQQPCQCHGQLHPVYLGYFEGSGSGGGGVLRFQEGK